MIHTTSLEVSRKLKKAGIEIETEWWWDLITDRDELDIGDKVKDEYRLSYTECYYGDKDDLIPAPTLGELVRRLPEQIYEKSWIYNLIIAKASGKYSVSYRSFMSKGESVSKEHIQWADTPEDCAGLMVIKLKQERKG